MYEGDRLDRNSLGASILLLVLCTALGLFIWHWFFVGTAVFALTALQSWSDTRVNRLARNASHDRD